MGWEEGQRLRFRSAASPMLSKVRAMAALAPWGQEGAAIVVEVIWVENEDSKKWLNQSLT